MSELPSQYKNITVYDIIGRITIKALLDRKVFYECCYYVIDEEDDPLPIRDSIAYLSNQNGNKKVYILKLKTVYGEFVK